MEEARTFGHEIGQWWHSFIGMLDFLYLNGCEPRSRQEGAATNINTRFELDVVLVFSKFLTRSLDLPLFFPIFSGELIPIYHVILHVPLEKLLAQF